MASALDAVLQLQSQEDNRRQQAVQMFEVLNQAKQQAQSNQFEQLKMAQQQNQFNQENKLKTLLTNAQIKNYESDALKNSQSNKILEDALSGNGGSGAFKPKSINVGGVTLENADISNLKTDRENRLVKQQEFSNSTKLRQEFINRPEVKDYMTVSPNIKSMDSLLSSGLNGDIKNMVALDQGLITMFNKLTDPQSVVRESEYARTPENLPFTNRFQGAFQKLQSGGAGLTNEDRKALVQGAKIIANERGGQFQSTLDEYKGTAAEYGLDEKLITRDIPDFKKFDTGVGDLINSNKKETPKVKTGFENLSDAELNARINKLRGK